MVTTENSSYSKKLLHLISWGHWFTFFNIGAALLIAIIFLDAEGLPEQAIGKVYMLTNWLSHMAFLTFITFVLTVFPLTLLFPKTQFIRGAASFIFSFVLCLLVIDGFTYAELGYHLNTDSSSQIFALLKEKFQFGTVSLTTFNWIIFIAILLFQLVMSNYCWKHLKELQQRKAPKYFIAVFVFSFFVSHLIHVWADAKLDYSVLRQDTVLPFSYPSTAKTLLTKYGLFDRADYEQRKNNPFSFTNKTPDYPELSQECKNVTTPQHSTFLVLNDKILTDNQIKQFNLSSSVKGSKLVNYIDNASNYDAWFNLLYGLPTIYQEDMKSQQSVPMLFKQIESTKLDTSINVFANKEQPSDLPLWISKLFTNQSQYEDISSFLFADKLNGLKPGLHVFYFSGQTDYQYELFVNALLLAQQQKEFKDIIWLSSLGNASDKTSLTPKPALFIFPERQSKTINELTSVMDVQTTLMKNWFNCRLDYKSYSNGHNIYRVKDDRLFANTTEDGLLVIKKDKNLFIDSQGNFETYSTQLDTLISEDSDFPMLIDGVKLINSFSLQNKPKEQINN
ncbi:DUF3413 domain-containing protein [Thalassotalea psychrophila]|uniref:DUF3413 domain-containing protein n=1 Tax=Thalassotalea psychrophila TaxID=3065647 RepID=A0ABY9TRX8_9GAMM|nr:DUF3413 domain-containing protein [Colwelliaceae bacterium SQ149]